MNTKLSERVSGKRYMIEREACSKADLPNWVIYLESVKVGSKATESPGGKSLRGGGGSKRNRQRDQELGDRNARGSQR